MMIQKRLHTTISAEKRNTYDNKAGFIINIHDSKIELDHPTYGKHSQLPYWEKITLKKSFEVYPKYLLYVKADHRGSDPMKNFIIMKHGSCVDLISAFQVCKTSSRRKNLYDVRIGFAHGRMHDHGTGFLSKA